MSDPKKIIIVGMGDRSTIYSRESLVHPELFKIVGVVDINPARVKVAQEMFDIPKEHCFTSIDDLVAVPKFADGVINGTMDQLHVATSIPLLKAGYDILLEKPFALNQKEADLLLNCVHETGRKVMICHVLRYTPFYRKIKEVLASGEIGDVINIQMSEEVSYFHESVSYIRGKYGSSRLCGSGMLLSKCSHDLDIMAWLMGDNKPTCVSSIGTTTQFKPEMAPEGAGTRCLLDCPVERECQYSARRLYLENPQRWANNVWFGLGSLSMEEKEHILSDLNNPFGRCVYRCQQDIVDHQSVLIGFKNGATGTFSMTGGGTASGRFIHITGTKGEIRGIFEDQMFSVYKIDPTAEGGRIERKEVLEKTDAHGGGDQEVIKDFVALLAGEKVSPCCTSIDDSVTGHKIVYLAEDSRLAGGQIQRYN